MTCDVKALRAEINAYILTVQKRIEAIEAKYNPSQPRVPRGNSDGGEWTDEGGSGSPVDTRTPNNSVGGYRVPISSHDRLPGGKVPGSGSKPLKLGTAIQALHDNVSPKKYGQGNCARNVANAVRASGIKVTPPPTRIREGATAPWAKDYGSSLEGAGFDRVSESGYMPQKGDVAVIQSIPGHPAGHMTMYDGKQWVSDFRQELGIWPSHDYAANKPRYDIYRHQNPM